tara:strand:+ start:55 stop:495 length:441 start_codon:yes stop_codon:yes gene_type:complete
MSSYDKIIDNLLDDNINLMTNINNTLEESDKKLENIENNNYYISLYNLKNWNILNRISNIWNRFIYYKEEEIKEKEIIMKKIGPKDFVNIDINSNVEQDKISCLKKYSNKISNKIDTQNNILKTLAPKLDDTNNKLKLNNSFIKNL